jgi:WD40 repeat protein
MVNFGIRQKLIGPAMAYFPKFFSAVSHCALATIIGFATASEVSARDSDPVWRVEIEFTTADISDASTDDRVEVRLNGENLTRLDYSRDDFERGTVYNYDLILANISTIADIERIEISKRGSDGWCIENFRLRINNVDAYNHSFAAPFLCLDNSANHERRFEVSGTTLRDDAVWRDYEHPRQRDILARGIPNDETISRVEALLGHATVGTDVYWGKFHGAPVELERMSDSRIHIDADMAYDRTLVSDDSYDIDVDLVVTCLNSQISVAYENLKEDLDFKWYKLFPLLNTYLFSAVPSIDLVPESLHSFRSGCPAIDIENNGDIIFIPPVQRVLDDPIADVDVDDCTFSSTLNAFIVTSRGARREDGSRDAGAIALVGLDGVLQDTTLRLSGYADDTTPSLFSAESIDGTLYLAERQDAETAGRATAAISVWDIKSGGKTDEILLPGVAAIRDFSVSSTGDIYLVEFGPDSRIFKASETGLAEFATDARRHLGTISSISIDDQGLVMLTGYDANLALVYDQDGTLIRRQIVSTGGVAHVEQHPNGTTFVSDGQRGALTVIDGAGIATEIHLDSPFVDAFCLSDDAKFVLVPFTVQSGYGVYPLDYAAAN